MMDIDIIFTHTIKLHFIVALLNGESRIIKLKKIILILATFIANTNYTV